jgi:hypothetical protein
MGVEKDFTIHSQASHSAWASGAARRAPKGLTGRYGRFSIAIFYPFCARVSPCIPASRITSCAVDRFPARAVFGNTHLAPGLNGRISEISNR